MQIKSEMRPEVCASLGLVTRVTVINEHVTKPKVKPDEELLTLTCKWKIGWSQTKQIAWGTALFMGRGISISGPACILGRGFTCSKVG